MSLKSFLMPRAGPNKYPWKDIRPIARLGTRYMYIVIEGSFELTAAVGTDDRLLTETPCVGQFLAEVSLYASALHEATLIATQFSKAMASVCPNPMLDAIAQESLMCKWARPLWGTECQRSPKSLS